jgi:eukaryotic-like serine/threonine-protein kinase
MSAFTRGQRIHDRFTLQELIGRGGMSEVWRATDGVLGRPVAVKALDTSLAADPVLWQATLREARAVARIAHPNVTQVHDYGEIPTPAGHVPYLVMELVDGQNLADRMDGRPLPPHVAASIAAQVAAGLAAAHRLGVVHRDVKPGNIMLTRGASAQESVKILDFGIATLAHGPDSDGGRLIGTPTYTAPERMRPGAATPAGDVYSLGVVLYEMLTGRPPRAYADWRQALAAPLRDVPPIDAPGVPPQLVAMTMACLSPDPARRPSAADLATGLSSLQPGYAMGVARPAPATPPTMVAAMGPEPPRRSRLLPAFLLTGGALAILLVVMLVYSLSDRSTPNAGPTATATATATTATSPTPAVSPSIEDSADPEAILDQIATLISSAGLRGNRSRDLERKLEEVRKRIQEDPADADGKIDDFRSAVDDLAESDQLDSTIADQINALLDQLSASL